MLLANKALPYPVLDNSDPYRDDYLESRYNCDLLDLEDQPTETGDVTFNFEHHCDVGELKQLIADGHAQYCVLVTCSDTLYRKAFLSSDTSQSVEMNIYMLHGKVELQPQIVATAEVAAFSSEHLNEEFGSNTFKLKPGDVLAVDDTKYQFLEFNRLKFETLINVRLAETIDPFTYRIDLTKNYIYILMGEKLWGLWSQLRYDQEARPYLAMSIYKDCFLHALEELHANFEEVVENRWARALVQKIEELGLSLPEEKDLNELNLMAQKILETESVKKLYTAKGSFQ